jgi:hypothetical protein
MQSIPIEADEGINGKNNYGKIDTGIRIPRSSADYEANLKILKALYHSKCMFNVNPPVSNLRFRFDDRGRLLGDFSCEQQHQGYDGIAHGGVLATIIDAAMVQCLMGHGFVTYTADLSIKYCKPVPILQPASLEAWIAEIKMKCLYSMRCEIVLNQNLAVQAAATFLKIPK